MFLVAEPLVAAASSRVAGATDFFEHIKGKKEIPRFLKYFVTHPQFHHRIDLLKEEIEIKGYEIKEKIPLSPIYKE